MVTKQQLQEKLDAIKAQVVTSKQKCEDHKLDQERMYANHNALLGAQMLAEQLVAECPDDIVTSPQVNEVFDGAIC